VSALQPSSSPGSTESTGLRRAVSDVTRRLQEIIDAAEAAAEEIRAEAKTQAAAETAEYVEERRRAADAVVEEQLGAVAEATGPLTERLAELRRQAIAIAEEVDRALAAIRELSFSAPPRPAVAGPSAVPSSPEPAEDPRQMRSAEDSPQVRPAEDSPPARARPAAPVFAYPGTSASASVAEGSPESEEMILLRATQMAVAGSDRTEIERTLRLEFSIEDPSEIVSEILGPDSA
jgi:hypothetical protein